MILEDIIFEDDPITSDHDINHDIRALADNVRSLEARIDLLTKEIRDLRDTKTNVVITVNNEVSAKHTTNTTSSPIESGDGSKPDGWIHPPDGWEWIGAKREYKHQMTGIRICYRPTYNEWEVVIPPNQTKLWGFVTESLSYAFENYAYYK